ncbi:MAG: GH3 auxin-responsive promoter [Candidatus Syntrophoarchaeum sp. GoM_oil]|nr:MAG: GH3 auxin-responsive promoter [Candidatus Syntrophoarchaeum sp. GoM_oil]
MKEYWNPIETMPRKELKELQLKKLRSMIKSAYDNTPFYHKMFKEAGVKPDDVKTFEDFRKKVPIFEKDDMRNERAKTKDPLAGMLSSPIEELLLLNPSTGTTGIPTFIAYSEAEIVQCTEMLSRLLWMGNARTGDKMLSCHMNWHWLMVLLNGAYRKLGLHTMYDFVHPDIAERYVYYGGFKPDLMFMDQPLLMAMRDEIREHAHCAPKDIYGGVKTLITAGESFPPKFKSHLMDEFGVVGDVFDLYGCSESHITAMECPVHNGNHFAEDMFYVELIDPDTGEWIDPDSGGSGQLVVTNLFGRDMPFVRYNTEDVTFMETEKCECGRTHARLKLRDRIPWRVTVDGKKLFPVDIRKVIEEFPETVEGAFTIVKDQQDMPELNILLRYDEEITKNPDELKPRIEAELANKLGVKANINWTTFSGLPIVFHKIERVTDLTKRK